MTLTKYRQYRDKDMRLSMTYASKMWILNKNDGKENFTKRICSRPKIEEKNNEP